MLVDWDYGIAISNYFRGDASDDFRLRPNCYVLCVETCLPLFWTCTFLQKPNRSLSHVCGVLYSCGRLVRTRTVPRLPMDRHLNPAKLMPRLLASDLKKRRFKTRATLVKTRMAETRSLSYVPVRAEFTCGGVVLTGWRFVRNNSLAIIGPASVSISLCCGLCWGIGHSPANVWLIILTAFISELLICAFLFWLIASCRFISTVVVDWE